MDTFNSNFETAIVQSVTEVEEEEEGFPKGEDQKENQDSFSSIFEQIVEQFDVRDEQDDEEEREMEEERDKSRVDSKDGFSSTFERIIESALLRGGTCYSSLDSLDELSLMGETDCCISFEAPLTPLIQQRVLLQGPEPLEPEPATVLERQRLQAGPGTKSEHFMDGQSIVPGAVAAGRGTPLSVTIPATRSDYVLSQPGRWAIPNGYHADSSGLGAVISSVR